MSSTNDPYSQSVESTNDGNPPVGIQAGHQTCATVYDGEEIKRFLLPIYTMASNHENSIQWIQSNGPLLEMDNALSLRRGSWMRDPDSNALWVRGPGGVPQPSQNTMAGIYLITELPNQSLFPLLSYSCYARIVEPTGMLSPQEMLLDMLKVFIVQLLSVKPVFATDLDLSQSRLATLLEPDVDIETALQIFIDVRFALAPGYFCVIEGAQYLEDGGNADHVSDVQRVFEEIIKVPHAWNSSQYQLGVPENRTQFVPGPEEPSPTTKVYFSSDGHTDVLYRLASQSDINMVKHQ